MNFKVSKTKILLYLILIVVSLIAARYGQPLIHENDSAITIIVTTFSILAGFLIAIIAIVGDPVSLAAGSWRNAEIEGQKAFKRLIRQKMLFFIYLITLALIFLSLLGKDKFPEATIWIEKAYLFLSVFGFFLSLTLPTALMKLQKERIENIIQNRRQDEGIKDGS